LSYLNIRVKYTAVYEYIQYMSLNHGWLKFNWLSKHVRNKTIDKEQNKIWTNKS